MEQFLLPIVEPVKEPLSGNHTQSSHFGSNGQTRPENYSRARKHGRESLIRKSLVPRPLPSEVLCGFGRHRNLNGTSKEMGDEGKGLHALSPDDEGYPRSKVSRLMGGCD